MSDERTLERFRKALEFYANPQRYNGPNQRAVDGDAHQPSTCPYLWDVTRDGGDIARRALSGE